jgi:hypothetical protein
MSSSLPLLPLPLALNDPEPAPFPFPFPLVLLVVERKDAWLRWACFEKWVGRSADLPPASFVVAAARRFFCCVPARVRDLRGLALGLRVVVVVAAVERGGFAAAAVVRVVRLRRGLGEAMAGGLLVLLLFVGLSGDLVLSGDEKRKRFRVFLFSCSSSSESSSMMARLRRFAGGGIADGFGLG